MKRPQASSFISLLALALFSSRAGAQAGPAPGPAGPPAPSEGANEAATENPPSNPGAATPYAGGPPGGGQGAPYRDVNAGLGQGNKPSYAGEVGKDEFNLQRGGAYGGEAIHGGKGSSYIVSGQFVPEAHTARRGDTLWEIAQKYFGNPYAWPRLWAFNRQLQNPHWIYPGDQIRLREAYVQQIGLGVGFSRLSPIVTPNTQFQRYVGYVLDGKTPSWGEVVGSPSDRQILTQEMEAYVQLAGDRQYEVGQKLIVFEPRKVDSLTDYPFVWIRGIVEIDRYNPKTKMARARVVESLSEIHRGCRVAPYERNLDVVAPVRNKKNVLAHIVGSLYPWEFYGQNQVVFIDKGTDDGLEPGNRLFLVRRGDRWRLSTKDFGFSVGENTFRRSLIEDDKKAPVEDPPEEKDAELYPAETYGELLVTRARKHTATCLITASLHEIPRGATLIAREGY